ncbi:MAG: hypothetical protein AB7E80_08190 [Hyphomicrobiaceae bacterium]
MAAPAPAPSESALNGIVLARIAADGGATRAEIIRDLGQLVAHRLSPGEWRQTAEAILEQVTRAGLADSRRGRYEATIPGLEAAAEALKLRKAGPIGPWAGVRDSLLIARALGLEAESAVKLKALGTPEGLRAVIVQKAFGLPRRLKTSPAKLRGELALVALERAFGNKIKSGLGSGTGLSAKAGRLLAGQLSRRPREFVSDSRLIAELAAEQAEAVQPTLDVLRAQILKRFVSELLDGSADAATPATKPSVAPGIALKPSAPVRAQRTPSPANDTAPAQASLPLMRPDLPSFVSEVARQAGRCAEGWPGNRRAFISQVWPAIRDARPEWGLSEIEFKCMLVEAHRAGGLALATADLKNKNNIKEIQDSAISYMNTQWHFVRVED